MNNTVRIVSGNTPYTGWSASHGASRVIDTTNWDFAVNPPEYFCSLRGSKDIWLTRGVSAIYDQASGWNPSGTNGFSIYIGHDESRYNVGEKDFAESDQHRWSVEWIGIEGPQAGSWVIDTPTIEWAGKKKRRRTMSL